MTDKKDGALPETARTAGEYTSPANRDVLRRNILGKNPSANLIANAKRVLDVLAIADEKGQSVVGEPGRGAHIIDVVKRDGRAIHELLDLCHALWPEATFTAKR